MNKKLIDLNLLPIIIGDIAYDIHETAVERGWWKKPRNDGEMINIIVSELTKAITSSYLKRYKNNKSEITLDEINLNDIIVTILDMCAEHKLHIKYDKSLKFNKYKMIKHKKRTV